MASDQKIVAAARACIGTPFRPQGRLPGVGLDCIGLAAWAVRAVGIEVDVPARRIHLDVGDDELARRRAAWTPPPRRYERGYGWLFSQHILQADQGCDFDFLETDFGAPVPEPVIY